MGGSRITGALGNNYRAFVVKDVGDDAVGAADLCSYFFLRGDSLLRRRSSFGFVATKTISQGDTRTVGLERLLNNGISIHRAHPAMKWPGDASVEVSNVWSFKGTWMGECTLDGNRVKGISSHLTPIGEVVGDPHELLANAGKSFAGVKVYGDGFVLTNEEAKQLLQKNSRLATVVRPYLTGQDMNTNPNQSSSRFVISFGEMRLDEAQEFTSCIEIVQTRVKPYRDRQKQKQTRENWWRFERPRPELSQALEGLDTTLAIALTSKTVSPDVVATDQVFDQSVIVFASNSMAFFSVIASSVHYWWVIQYGTPMRGDARYIRRTCFETFPFPTGTVDASEPPHPALRDVGTAYQEYRRALMLHREEGLTKTYNRFHDTDELSSDIQRLRELHIEMDQAVVTAYGWNDFKLGHDFCNTKQGLRFTISEPARREVLQRLLKLNHQRYAEEVKQGLHDKQKSKAQKTSTPKKSKKSQPASRMLFGDDDDEEGG